MRRRPGVQQAFDEARFGSANILNVREPMLTGPEAVRRTEAFLRTRQLERAGDVLIVTGRGNGSPGQIPVVREQVRKLLFRLRRGGVVREIREHTAGSFAVTLAPLSALLDAPRRQRDTHAHAAFERQSRPSALAGLDSATMAALHRLAVCSLEALGVHAASEAVIRAEMERQFSLFVRGNDRADASTDAWLRGAIDEALREFEDGEW